MASVWEHRPVRKINPGKWPMPPAGAEVASNVEVRAQVCSYVDQLSQILIDLPLARIEAAVELIVAAQGRGSSVYVFGNGGSASTASHLACDLLKSTVVEGMPRLRVIALTDNMAVFSAWANDSSYDLVFAEQLVNFGRHGDLAIAISASGNSPNVIAGTEAATALGMYTIGLCGFGGGELAGLVDLPIVVGSHDYGRVEDAHLAIGHAISSSIRSLLAGPTTAQQREPVYTGPRLLKKK